MSTEQKLTAHAKDWEAVHLMPPILDTDDWQIIRDKAIHRAWVTLDMRYQTYSENSWTADVLRMVEVFGKHDTDEAELWRMREVQIIQEVRRELSRSLVQLVEKRKHESTI